MLNISKRKSFSSLNEEIVFEEIPIILWLGQSLIIASSEEVKKVYTFCIPPLYDKMNISWFSVYIKTPFSPTLKKFIEGNFYLKNFSFP